MNALCFHLRAPQACSLVIHPLWGLQYAESWSQSSMMDDLPALWGCLGRHKLMRALFILLSPYTADTIGSWACGKRAKTSSVGNWLLPRLQRWDSMKFSGRAVLDDSLLGGGEWATDYSSGPCRWPSRKRGCPEDNKRLEGCPNMHEKISRCPWVVVSPLLLLQETQANLA